MGRLLLGLFFLAHVGTGWCEGVRAIPVSLCTLDGHPERYNAKMVRVRGLVVGAEGLYLSANCGRRRGGMALSFPLENAVTPQPFDLVRDDAYRKLMNYVNAPAPTQPKAEPEVWTLSVAPRYCDIRVTIIGRFEAVSEEKALRGRGFGNGGASPFQLIVRSVVDPEAKECASPPAAPHR